MSYFEYTKGQLLELINAYEDYCDELVNFPIGGVSVVEAAWDNVKEIREELGVPVE